MRNQQFLLELEKKSQSFVDGGQWTPILETLITMLKSPKKQPAFSLENYRKLACFHLHSKPEGRSHIPSHTALGELHLLAERFFWKWPVPNLGSSRHGLLYDMQIKGMGRNPLTARLDYVHSWGGQYLWQALRGYVVSHLFAGIVPKGFLKTSLISVASQDISKKQLHHAAQSLLLRDAQAYRVTQLMTEFDPAHAITKPKVRELVEKRIHTKKIDDHMDQLLWSYSTMLIMGLRHMAVTRENTTLEGSLIDYEDLQIDLTQDHYRFFLVIEEVKKKERLYSTSLHFYLDALELSVMGLKNLYPEWKITPTNIRQRFLKMLKTILSEVFTNGKEHYEFLKEMMTLTVVYNKGENPHSQAAHGKMIKKLFQNYAFELMISEKLDDTTMSHYQLLLPQLQFKESFLQQHNYQILKNATDLTQEAFKWLQLEHYAGPWSEEKSLEVSSKINHLISEHAMIWPYEWKKGIKRKKQKLKNFKNDITKHKLSQLGAKFVKFETTPAGKEILIKGVHVELPGKIPYYMFLKPSLVNP